MKTMRFATIADADIFVRDLRRAGVNAWVVGCQVHWITDQTVGAE